MNSIVILSEGTGDEAFVAELIEKRGLSNFQVHKVADVQGATAGVGSFDRRLKALKTESGLDDCKLVVVIADNDGDPGGQFRKVVASIRSAGDFGIPTKPMTIANPLPTVVAGRHIPAIVVVMLPWDGTEGNLESMCFAAGKTKNPRLARCVEAFVKCVRVTGWEKAKIWKLKARCMLSASVKKKPDIPLTASWRSDSGDPFPVTNRCFDRLAKYLKHLSNEVSPKPKARRRKRS